MGQHSVLYAVPQEVARGSRRPAVPHVVIDSGAPSGETYRQWGCAPSRWKIKSFQSSFNWGEAIRRACKSYQRRCFPRKRRDHKASPLKWHKTHALLLNFFRAGEWRASKVMVCSPSENIGRIHIACLNLLVSRSEAAEADRFQSQNLRRILESFVFCSCNMRIARHTGSTIVHDPQFIRHRGTTRNLALVNADFPLKCLVLNLNAYWAR